MRKGEKAFLQCTAPFAYGASGSPPTIPPNATLRFEVELLGFGKKAKAAYEMTAAEQAEAAEAAKAEGNRAFTSGDLEMVRRARLCATSAAPPPASTCALHSPHPTPPRPTPRAGAVRVPPRLELP